MVITFMQEHWTS